MTEENKSLQTPQNEPEPEAEPVDTAAAMQYFEASEAAAEVGREILASRKPKKQKQKKPKKQKSPVQQEPETAPAPEPVEEPAEQPAPEATETNGWQPSRRGAGSRAGPCRTTGIPGIPGAKGPQEAEEKEEKIPAEAGEESPRQGKECKAQGKTPHFGGILREHGARLRLHRHAAAAGILCHSPGHRSCVRPCPGPGAHPVAEPAL